MIGPERQKGDHVDHNSENAAARERVLGLVGTLSDAELQRRIDDDWTVGAELAHLAFWDRVHGGRLRRAIAGGQAVPPPLPDGLTDSINDGELPAWRALSGSDAVRLFAAASADVDGYIATLDVAAIDGVRQGGMPRLIERSRHRNEHADAIERGRG
jgi:DinB superfamily